MSDEDDWDREEPVTVATAEELRRAQQQQLMLSEARLREREAAAVLPQQMQAQAVASRMETAEKREAELAQLLQKPDLESKSALRRRLVKLRRKAIYARLTPEQRDRYEHYLNCAMDRSSVKKVMGRVLMVGKVSDALAIVMSGITKIFCGDLIEQGLLVMAEWGHSGPVRLVHLREAYRRVRRDDSFALRKRKLLLR
jgi:transcription initiation factor TFIID subunit 11